MRAIIIALLALSLPAQAGTAFLKKEIRTSGTKQCVYLYLGNTYILTVQSFELCPLNIEVRDHESARRVNF